jgi:hypothetical protein
MAQLHDDTYYYYYYFPIAEDDDSESVYVMLNGEESELVFTYVTNIKVRESKGKSVTSSNTHTHNKGSPSTV